MSFVIACVVFALHVIGLMKRDLFFFWFVYLHPFLHQAEVICVLYVGLEEHWIIHEKIKKRSSFEALQWKTPSNVFVLKKTCVILL